MNGRPWTKREIAIIRRDYPKKKTALIAEALKRPLCGVYQTAKSIGVKKSAKFLASSESGRLTKLTRSGIPHRFRKGHVPANAGLRRPGWSVGRMSETQFKKGQRSGVAAANWVPVGSYRINADGYLDRKIRDDGPPQKRWVGVHRLVWIEANGPLPPGHVVVFKPGRRTTKVEEIALDILELKSRGELMLQNSYHTNYPKAIGELIQLRGAVQRQINKRTRLEKQD